MSPGEPAARQVTLVVVCGLPGSGKTTAATRLAAELGAVRVNADEWLAELGISLWDIEARARVERVQRRLVEDLLTARCSVVVEWGTWARSERDALRETGHRLGATVELHHLDAPDDELWRRISARDREDPPITREHVATWRPFFEVPTPDELARYDVARVVR